MFENPYPLMVTVLLLALIAAEIRYRFLLRRLRTNEEHFRNLAEASFEGIVLSLDGVVVDCNARLCEMTGFSREELINSSLYNLVVPEMEPLARSNVAGGYDKPYQLQILRKDGSRFNAEILGRTFTVDHRLGRATTVRDMTAHLAEESLIHKLFAAVENCYTSIMITDAEGIIEYVNPAFYRLSGYEPDEVIGRNPSILKSGRQSAEFYRELWSTLKRGEEWRGEFHNRRKDGTLFWESAAISPVFDDRDRITHFVAVKENVTEKKEMLDRLEQMAQFDMLTTLPNRRMLLDRLAQSVAISRRSGTRFALLFIDLDDFKRINDTYGHEAGDRVLKTVAARLSGCVRISDMIGRMGGDEFTVLLGTITRYEDAGQVAEKIISALTRPITLPDGTVEQVGCSIGISVFPDNAEDGNRLLATADYAMYEVKRVGKGGYRFYAPEHEAPPRPEQLSAEHAG